MSKKNKTVKELNADIELFIKRMDKYEDTSKDNEKLKQKVENMEKVLQSNQKEIKTLKDFLKNEVEIHAAKRSEY